MQADEVRLLKAYLKSREDDSAILCERCRRSFGYDD